MGEVERRRRSRRENHDAPDKGAIRLDIGPGLLKKHTTTPPEGTMEEARGLSSPGSGEARRKVHLQTQPCLDLKAGRGGGEVRIASWRRARSSFFGGIGKGSKSEFSLATMMGRKITISSFYHKNSAQIDPKLVE